MEKIKRILTWALLLNKRLFKKPGFLVILLLIPALVFGVNLMAQEDSGAVTVALAMEDPEDPLANEIVDSMIGSSRLLRFISCQSPQEARSMVAGGKADTAWIFGEDLQESIDRFAGNIHRRNAFVTVVQREETVLLQLAREKLYAAVYPHCSYALYRNYLDENVPELPALTPEQLRKYYDAIQAEGADLFEFSYADPEESTEDAETVSYLLAPMRGLLSVMVLLGGFAVALFYMQDEAAGKFDWIPEHKRFWFAAGYHLIAVVNVAAAALMAILLSGLSVSLGREILLMALYALMTTGFAMVVRQLTGKAGYLGALIPVLTVAAIALCPVFFNFSSLRMASMLLPPYYYLNCVHNVGFMLWMLGYTAVLYLVSGLLHKLKTP